MARGFLSPPKEQGSEASHLSLTRRLLPITPPDPQELELSVKLLWPSTPSLTPHSGQRASGTLHGGYKISNLNLVVRKPVEGKTYFQGISFLTTSVIKIKKKAEWWDARTFSKFITGIHYSWATLERPQLQKGTKLEGEGPWMGGALPGSHQGKGPADWGGMYQPIRGDAHADREGHTC